IFSLITIGSSTFAEFSAQPISKVGVTVCSKRKVDSLILLILLCPGFDIIGLTFFSKPWKSNAYFQLEFIKYCIRSNNVAIILSSCHNPSFHLSKLVPQVELLKCQPDYDNDIQLVPWKFQSLYQILSDLGENQMLYPFVEEIFFFPLNKCPDLLVLGLLECYGS